MKVILDILVIPDKRIAEFMEYLDFFNSTKSLVAFTQYEVTGEPDLSKLCENVKEAFEQAGGMVTFASIRTVDGVFCNEYPNYIKEGISTISTGHKWGMFNEYLESIGYEVRHDSRMRVLSAKLKISTNESSGS